MHGLSKLLETVNLVSKRVNRDLKVGGIVLCLYDAGTRHGGEVIEDLETFFEGRRNADAPWADAKVYKTRIRRNIRLAECPSFGQSIFQYAPTSRAPKTMRHWPPSSRGKPRRRCGSGLTRNSGRQRRVGRRRLGGVKEPVSSARAKPAAAADPQLRPWPSR